MDRTTQDASPHVGDLARRMTEVCGVLRNLCEDGTNSFHGYGFVTLGAVTDAVRRAMADAGVAVLPSVVEASEEVWETKRGNAMKVTLTMAFTWVAAESGESMTTQWRGVGIDNGDKAYNKAYSAILKQALQKTFLIGSTGLQAEDPDFEEPDPNKEPARALDEIYELLEDAGVLEGERAEFLGFLADSYRVRTLEELPHLRLASIRNRLASLPRDERRSTVIAKISAGIAA